MIRMICGGVIGCMIMLYFQTTSPWLQAFTVGLMGYDECTIENLKELDVKPAVKEDGYASTLKKKFEIKIPGQEPIVFEITDNK